MMSGPYRDLVCDTIDDIATLTSLPEIGARFAAAVKRLGFNALGLSGLPPLGENSDPVVVIENAPEGFRDHYVHERFYAVNHLAAHARIAHDAFRFSDAPYARDASYRHKRFMQALESYDMGKGIVVPIGRPATIPACVWLAGKNPELHDEAMRAIHLISLFAASKAHGLSVRTDQDKLRTSPLTKREREVLQWAATGKSAWEIGEIVGIAKRTVDEHVRAASRKLKAVNRTHAVVTALREGLISW